MKKAICILLLLATVFSASLTLTGCGKEPSEGNINAVSSLISFIPQVTIAPYFG